ncbi:MAG: Methylase, partial [Candidatus Peregrinibacteria bacterium Greene1014_49]
AGLRRQFDVIIANLPQDIVPPDGLSRLTDEQHLAIVGGPLGDDAIRDLLSVAPDHMHTQSRLYVPVYTGARYAETEKMIRKSFDITKRRTSTVECKPHVSDNIDFYRDLLRDGTIDIFQRNKKWSAHQFEYELKRKK